jgi:SAM-dependent methyltransferase
VPETQWSAVDAAPDPSRLLTGLDALRAEPFFAESKARMTALLGATPADHVLDIGCGSGEDAIALAVPAIGVERSVMMCHEARSRHPNLALVAGDAAALPIRDAHVDALRVDRVLQHLPDAPAALREWRRVLRRDGLLVCFDPDLTTARVDGVDERAASIVLGWRSGTRPGGSTVHDLAEALRTAGYVDVRVEASMLDLTDLDRADGIMGLATWGRAAADAGLLSRDDAQGWSRDVRLASRKRRLRYRCSYLLAEAKAG